MAPEILLLLSEPTAGLDSRTIQRLCRILNRLKLPCVIVSHDGDFLSPNHGSMVWAWKKAGSWNPTDGCLQWN